MTDGLKVLALDLETSPNLAYVWGLWKQNVGLSQLVSSTEVICWGAQWVGQDEVMFDSVHQSSRVEMVERIHGLVDEADAILGWNSKGFDMKHLNREFLEAGMLPPSPVKHIDLMLAVKRKFRTPSNKLDYYANLLLGEGKVQHSGFDLWKRCMAGDPEAWAEMEKYQKQDVRLLPELLEILLPWIDNYPSVPAHTDDDGLACTRCGSHDLRREGFAFTTTGKRQRYQCRKCGSWLQGARHLITTELREAR